MLNLLKTLCSLDGVSGYEDAVRDYIRTEAEPYADSIMEDVMGNLIVFKKGKVNSGRTIMLAAHMDEVGLIVTDITDDGFLHFGCSGGIDSKVLLGTRVRVGEKRIPGVVGVKAVHLTPAEERSKLPLVRDMYIDIGATSREEAEKLVQKGDFAAFDSEPRLYGNMLKAKAIDDRIGCAVMAELIKEEPEYDTWFVWLVGEEIGGRGARVAAQRLNPGLCLNLEGTSAGDLPGVPAHVRACQLGKGPAVSLMDGKTIYTRRVVRELTAAADKAGVTWQYRLSANAGNDAGPIHQANGGCEICTISAPIRYMHSACNVAYYPDLEAMEQLARIFVNEVSDHV